MKSKQMLILTANCIRRGSRRDAMVQIREAG